jgi:hypothetical protein
MERFFRTVVRPTALFSIGNPEKNSQFLKIFQQFGNRLELTKIGRLGTGLNYEEIGLGIVKFLTKLIGNRWIKL